MKRYKELLLLFLTLFAFAGCAENDIQNNIQNDVEDTDNAMRVDGISASMGAMDANGGVVQTRSVADFAVNTALDPTATLVGREAWKFDFQIYKGGAPYSQGAGTLVWNASASRWEPTAPIYFPNYTKQFVAAKLYPTTANATIALDQSTDLLLLAQDILMQNGATTVTVNPAHIPAVPMRHAHSMLDMVLDDVNASQIASLKVFAGNVEYTPYKVDSPDKTEYLLVLPLGTQNPEIRLTTVGGATYTERVDITGTQVNVCYCVHLKGIELVVSTLDISDWTYGKALEGTYSTVTSYPTFQGMGGDTYTVYFDTGLSQVIKFNTNGERIMKPLGRIIVKMERNGVVVDTRIVLNSMVIDLSPYFP